jgi:hypothetical protein
MNIYEDFLGQLSSVDLAEVSPFPSTVTPLQKKFQVEVIADFFLLYFFGLK